MSPFISCASSRVTQSSWHCSQPHLNCGYASNCPWQLLDFVFTQATSINPQKPCLRNEVIINLDPLWVPRGQWHRSLLPLPSFFLSSYSITQGTFLSFQVSKVLCQCSGGCENCSICRCNLDAFLEINVLYVLLHLGCLDSSLYNCSFLEYKSIFFFIVEIKQSNQSVIEDNSWCHHLETTTVGILLRSFCIIYIYTYICHINFNNVVSYWGNLAFLFNDVLYSLNFR